MVTVVVVLVVVVVVVVVVGVVAVLKLMLMCAAAAAAGAIADDDGDERCSFARCDEQPSTRGARSRRTPSTTDGYGVARRGMRSR